MRILSGSIEASTDVVVLSATWIRDSSFTLYALIRLGFTQEAHGRQFGPMLIRLC